MLLPRFEYHAPADLSEALEILDMYQDQARVLAGGTDLLVNMKKKLVRPTQVMALDRLEALDEVALNGALTVGARKTAAFLAQDSRIVGSFGVLASGAGSLGSPLIRNRATIGGNLVTARPASDMAPPLLVLGASVVLASRRGEREVPLQDYYQGPGQTVKEADELLTKVIVPVPGPGTGGGYVKLGLRKAMEIALVNVAALLTLDENGRTIKAAKVALGAVGPTPIISPDAERALVGQEPSEEVLVKAGQVALSECSPISDHRGTFDYRCQMIEVLTRRALNQALANARASLEVK